VAAQYIILLRGEQTPPLRIRPRDLELLLRHDFPFSGENVPRKICAG
jgi:hypothetical protein